MFFFFFLCAFFSIYRSIRLLQLTNRHIIAVYEAKHATSAPVDEGDDINVAVMKAVLTILQIFNLKSVDLSDEELTAYIKFVIDYVPFIQNKEGAVKTCI